MHQNYILRDTDLLATRFAAKAALRVEKEYDAKPGMFLPVLIAGELRAMRWGLQPEWAVRKNSPFSKIFQPREELMLEIMKNGRRQRKVKYKRCIVPATSFFESAKSEEEEALRHDAPAGTMYGLAGTWESWTDDSGKEHCSFAIITVKRHKREAPIVLNPKAEAIWLDPTFSDWNVLGSILQIPKKAPAYE